MPIIEDIHITPHTRIVVWEITEKSEDLIALLPPIAAYQREIAAFSRPQRRVEYALPRYILHSLMGISPTISYTSQGAPYLTEGYHLSLSHTGLAIAVALSTSTPLGVDVEEIRERVLGVSKRFTHPEEEQYLSPEELLPHLTLLWSIKESLFKAYPGIDIDFKQQLRVETFSPTSQGETTATVLDGTLATPYTVGYRRYPSFVLTYALSQ